MTLSPRNKPDGIHMHFGDLPDHIVFGETVAIDTETQGLNLLRDRLCLLQISDGHGQCHLVQFSRNDYSAPNLKKLLADQDILKIFHFARFDIAIIKQNLDILCGPVYCTKIASKLVRTYTERHGLRDVTKEIIGIDLSKEQQSSDWSKSNLTEAQKIYAASDVLNLHLIKKNLDLMLEREGRKSLAKTCFEFLPSLAMLDLMGWRETDIFSH